MQLDVTEIMNSRTLTVKKKYDEDDLVSLVNFAHGEDFKKIKA